MARRIVVRVLAALVATMALVLPIASQAVAATNYTWTSAVNDDWDRKIGVQYMNWNPKTALPGADPADTVTFSAITPAALGYVNLNGTRTVASVTFGNSTGAYTLQGATSVLTTGQITQTAAATGATANQITTPVVGNGGSGSDLGITVAGGSLKLTGVIDAGGWEATLNGNVTNGTLELTNISSATPNNISSTSNVTVGTGGVLKIFIHGDTSALGDSRVTLSGGQWRILGGETTDPGLLQEFYAGLNHDTDAVQGAILLPMNGAGFDKLGPGGASYVEYNYQWVYSSWLDYPGTANSVAGAPCFTNAAGTLITDHTGANVHIGNEAASYDHFGLRATGLIKIDTAGNYAFTIGSDDGSKLWINDTLVVDNDFLQGYTQRSGSIYLDPGYYPFVTAFYERDGDAGFDLRWDGGVTGAPITLVPDGTFWHGAVPGGTIGNDVTVTASSGIEVEGIVHLGNLTLGSGATLSLSTPNEGQVTFNATTIDGTGGAMGIHNAIEAHVGILSDYGMGGRVVKTGLGDLVFDQTANPNQATTTAFQADEGLIVVVGSTGGFDPLGGATLGLNGGVGAVLTSQDGDWALGGDVEVLSDSVLEVKKWKPQGYADTATISVQGNLEIAPGATLHVQAAAGYTLNLQGTTTNTGGLRIDAGRVTVASSGSLGSAAEIYVASGSLLRFNGSGGLGLTNVVTVEDGAFLSLGAAQTTFPSAASGGRIDVAAFGALGGDLTGANYNPSGGSQNVFLAPDAVLALTAGPAPTRAQVGGAVLWRGITSLAGSYTNLGDNGSTSIYQGVIFDNAWTDVGNFSGTLGEASGASGFEVVLNRDVAFQSAILTAATGATHEVAFSGPGRLTLGTGAFGGGTTARVYAHRGVAATVDDPGTTGLATVTANVAGVLRSGMSLRIENGVFSQGGTVTTAIAAGATVDAGPDGVILGNHTTGQVNVLAGGLMRLGATGWAVPARTAFSDGAGLYLDFNALNWDTEQLPKDKALDLLVANDGSFAAGLYLGQGSRLLVVPGAGSLTINAGATGIVKTTGGLPVTGALIATPGGTTATFASAVQMSGVNLTLGSVSLMMPSGVGGTAADFARRPAGMGGSLLFGGSFHAGNAMVAAGAVYATNADFNVLGDLDVAGPASTLYLGGGGDINGATHGEQTARLTSTTGLAADRVAGRILLRDTTRLEMGLLDSAPRDPVTGRVHVTQPIVIAGAVNPADKRSVWVSRRGGTALMPVTLTDLTLAPGGVFAVDDSDTTLVRANFKVAGASTVALFDNFEVQNMVRDLSLPPYDGTNPAVVKWGRTDEAGVLVSSIYGSIGAGVRIDMIHGSLYFRNGSRLDGVVDTSTAPTGGDSYVVVYAGRDGVPANRLAGTGTVRLGRTPVGVGGAVGPEDIGLLVDEAGTGVAPFLNVVTQTIRVVDDGTTAVDGIVRTDRGVDNAVNGYGRYTHVEIEQGATLTVQSWNEQNVVADFTLVAPSATVDETGTDATRVYMGNITGTGAQELVLAGNSNTSLIGALTNATLTLTNTATTTLADRTAILGAGNRFSTSGATINANGGILDFGVIGASGTGGLGSGLTINLGSGGALKGRVDEVATGLPAILATHAPTIRVATTGRILFEKNLSTAANNGVAYFPNVHLADGAHLAVNQGVDTPSGLFGLTLEGSGSFASENSDNVWLGNVTGSGGTLTWLRHPADAAARTLKLTGTLAGADVRLDALNTTWQLTSLAVGTYAGSFQLGNRTLTLANGNSLDLYVAPGAGLIDSVTTPGGPPINIYKGADGTPGLTAATHIRLAQGNTLRGFVREVDGSQTQIVNHIYANVDIATAARLESERSNDAALDGFAFFHNVNLAPGARADLNRLNGSLVASLNLEADGYASNVSNGATIFVADVTGTGAAPASLVIDGITDMGLVGTLTNADVHLTTTNTTYLLDMTPTGLGRKFALGGRTVYAQAGTLQVGGTKAGWGSMGAPNANLDPGTGTIDQTAGLVVIHSGQDGSKGPAGWGAGVTIAKNADTLTTLRVNEAGPYDLSIENVFNGRVQMNVAGTLAADRNVDLQTPGTAYFTNVHLPDAMTVRLQSINDQNIKAGIVLDGATGLVQNDSSSTRVFLGNASGAGTLILVGGQVTHAAGSLATGGVRVGNPAAAGSLTLDPTATVGPTTGFEVTSTGTLRVNAPVGGAYAVRSGGLLIIGNAGFTGAVTKDSGAQIGLASSAPYTENDPGTTLLIAVPEYSGLLALAQNDTQIGAIVTDQAGIISTLAGAATQVNFSGGTHLLHLGKDGLATPVVTGGRHVNVNRNVVFHSANNYTGGTTVGGGKATVLDPDALGSGAVTVAGGELEIRPAGFASGAVAVTGGTLDLYADFAPALTLGGGTIETHGNVEVSGALTDAGNLTLRASAGDTLTFTGGLALNGGRQWNVDAGTVEFLGNVTGAQGLTKLGAGTLKLAGAPITALTVGNGTAAGGLVVIANAASLPGTVLINAQSAYGVADDHGYGEVNLLNSAGCLALGADTSADLAMLNEFVTVGASADAVYTGTLTPYDDGASPVVYRLGGGGAQLTVQTELTDIITGTDVQIGRDSPGTGDITHQGEVLLDSPTGNSFTGVLSVYGYAGITDWSQVGGAGAVVRVYAGGSLDLGGLAVPALHNVDLSAGGGVSSNASTLTTDDIYNLFNGADEVVLGGGMFADGITTVADGALVDWDLRKIGPNEVVLANPGGWSSNGGISLVTVEGGTLTVSELTSLGNAFTVRLTGDGRLNVTDTGMDDLIDALEMDNAATIEVAPGETVLASSLTLLNNTARGTLTGGGTLDLGDIPVQAPADNGAQIEIAGQSTLVTRYGGTDAQRANLFRVRGGSTLAFATADVVDRGGGVHVQNQAIGWMYPDATIEFGPNLGLGTGQWQTVNGNPGLTLDVDPADYDDTTPQTPYVLRIGSGSRIDFWNGSATSSLRSAAFTDDLGGRRWPVAYVRKEGAGTMEVFGTAGYDLNDTTSGRVFHWTVAGGLLDAIDANALGADAYAWAYDGQPASIANQHLEGIEVAGGATLAWDGVHGFLPAGVYGRGTLPIAEGDGWNPGEFVLHDGATLRSTRTGLGLGFALSGTAGTANYLAFPTVTGAPGSTPSITLNGRIDFRSGIAVDPQTSGLIDVTVNGTVKFTSDLASGVGGVTNPGIDKIAHLTLASGSAVTIGQSHQQLAATTADTSRLLFDPGAGKTITYGSPSHTLTQVDGTVRAASGITDMGQTMIAASSRGLPPSPTSFMENIDDNSLLKVDGATLLNDMQWNVPTVGTVQLAPGWHDIEFRAGNYGGPGGAYATPGFGFGYDPLGRASTNQANYILPADDGSMSLLRTLVGGVWVPGLKEGRLAGGFDTTGANPGTAVTLDLRMAQAGTSPPWGEQETWVYTGQFYVAPVVPMVQVDAGAELRVRGFTGMGITSVDGKLALGEATSTTAELWMTELAGVPKGTVDLGRGNLVVNYDPAKPNPYAQVLNWVRDGLNLAGGGKWNGPGITSSVAATDPQGLFGVACIDNTMAFVGGFTALEGTAVDASSVLLKVTYAGDANLDGVIDANDYDRIDKYYLFPPAVMTWGHGDFNYDGVIDANDYDKIDKAYLFQGAPMGAGATAGDGGGAMPVATPEPATLALLALGAAATLARRRRTR